MNSIIYSTRLIYLLLFWLSFITQPAYALNTDSDYYTVDSKVKFVNFKGSDDFAKGSYATILHCNNGIKDSQVSIVSAKAKSLLLIASKKYQPGNVKVSKIATEYGQTCAYLYTSIVLLEKVEDESIDIHEILSKSISFTTKAYGQSKNSFISINKGTPRNIAINKAKINAIERALSKIDNPLLVKQGDIFGIRDIATKILLKSKKGIINKYSIISESSKKNIFFVEIEAVVNLMKLKKMLKSMQRRTKKLVYYLDPILGDHHSMIKGVLDDLKIKVTKNIDESQLILYLKDKHNKDTIEFIIKEPGQDLLYSWTSKYNDLITNNQIKRAINTSLLMISSKGGPLYRILIDHDSNPGIDILGGKIRKMRGMSIHSIKSRPYAIEILIRSNFDQNKLASRFMKFLSQYISDYEVLFVKNKEIQFKKSNSKISDASIATQLLINSNLKITEPQIRHKLDSTLKIESVISSTYNNTVSTNFLFYGSQNELDVYVKALVGQLSPLPFKLTKPSSSEFRFTAIPLPTPEKKSFFTIVKFGISNSFSYLTNSLIKLNNFSSRLISRIFSIF